MDLTVWEREKWQQEPNSIALACKDCKGPITPCIVCAHPIPFVDDSVWKTCDNCGILNPMHEIERHCLGIPPPLALTPEMVRRVMVCHIGRTQYTRALQLQHVKLKKLLKGFEGHDQRISKLQYTKEAHAKEMAEDALSLPFLECAGILYNPYTRGRLKENSNGDISENEPVAKRMKITPIENGQRGNTVGGHHGYKEVGKGKLKCSIGLDESIKDGSFAAEGSIISRESSKEYGQEKKNKEKEKDSRIQICPKCHGFLLEKRLAFLEEYKNLAYIEAQLLALHSAGLLLSNLHSSAYVYPICHSSRLCFTNVLVSGSTVNGSKAICASHQHAGPFSIQVLRLAHDALDSEWKRWLINDNLNINEHLPQEVFSCSEIFIQKRHSIFDAQRLMWMSKATETQACIDSDALLEHQLYPSAGSIIQGVFKSRFMEKFTTWKRMIQPFHDVSSNINVLLQFYFTQIREFYSIPSNQLLFPNKLSNLLLINKVDTIPEALRAAVPLWILLYHDIAHATSFGKTAR